MKAFGNYHPAVLMTYFVSVLVLAMFVSDPVLRCIALTGGMLFCFTILPKKGTASNIAFYTAMFLLITVTNPLFSHNGVTPLFFLNGNPVTREAVLYGAAMAVTVVGVMLWCKCYSEIMTSDKFLYLFGKAAPKLSLTLSMALRLIPLLKRQTAKVKRAQTAMGMYSTKSLVDRFKSTARLFTAMIAWSLENSMETAASMRARGYGKRRRTHFSLFRFTVNDLFLLTVCILLFSVTVAVIATGAVDFYYYPKTGGIELSVLSVSAYFAYAAISLLPFIIEVRENLTWKYYISKI